MMESALIICIALIEQSAFMKPSVSCCDDKGICFAFSFLLSQIAEWIITLAWAIEDPR